mgnify:FL=1
MKKLLFTTTLIFSFALQPLVAMADGAVRFSNNAFKQVIKEDASGSKAFDYVEPGLVIPGDVLMYEVGFENISDKPITNIVINNPIPNNSAYRQGSATAKDYDVTFSVDGKDFKAADKLVVKDKQGKTWLAKPEQYSHIRWVYKNTLQTGEKKTVTYKTVIKKATE